MTRVQVAAEKKQRINQTYANNDKSFFKCTGRRMTSNNPQTNNDDSDSDATTVAVEYTDNSGKVIAYCDKRDCDKRVNDNSIRNLLWERRQSRIQITRNVLKDPPPPPRRSNRVLKPVDRYSPSDDD